MKFLKWVGIILVTLVAVAFVGGNIMKSVTKKHSPEDTVNYSQRGLELSVVYCRPYKKERVIFGGLVPYGEIWRTGANEPTTFSTNQELTIGENTLAAGKYTVWTIPEENEWTVIFNSKIYDWGVDFKSQSSRDPEYDVVQVIAPVASLPASLEQFTIGFEEGENTVMTLSWDRTKISVPLQ